MARLAHPTTSLPHGDDRGRELPALLHATTTAGFTRAARYAASVVVILIVVAVRLFVAPAWSLAHPYLLFYPAVALAGWFGGFGPALATTLLSPFALTYFWLPPLYSMRIRDLEDVAGLLLFVAIGFAISLLSEARLRANDRAHKVKEDAARAP